MTERGARMIGVAIIAAGEAIAAGLAAVGERPGPGEGLFAIVFAFAGACWVIAVSLFLADWLPSFRADKADSRPGGEDHPLSNGGEPPGIVPPPGGSSLPPANHPG